MIEPRLEWLLPEPLADPPRLAGFDRPVATLLARRGFTGQAQLDAFLGAGRAALHDVSLMTDADRALDRIDTAVRAGERIAIWGDYDADGMTAVVVWVLALRALGVEALRYVPSRLSEGYGLSVAGLQHLSELGATLVITCDCGVVNVAEVAAARRMGLDVVVTDHHLPGPVLPDAAAVVDPHRADCAYPDADLTGAGIAYKLASALLARHRREAPDLAGLAAIGTVADMAPMTGESRAIVRLGLAELGSTRRGGLRALLSRALEHPEAPTARDLGFSIAPRINAAGRIAEAELAISLLLEPDRAVGERIADELEAVHLRRRELTGVAVEAARILVEGRSGVGPILVRDDEWPAGIIGLVAGRLADSLARPVGAVTQVGDELRGSIRSPADFHVAVALEACASHLAKRGGHAAAGGFSVEPGRWEAFRAAFEALTRPLGAADQELALPGRIAVDLVLPAVYLGWELSDQLERLAPYGPGHLEPILAVTGLRVGDARRVGVDGGHVAFRLRRSLETFDAVAFGTPPDRPLPEEGAALDLIGTLERDSFQGVPRLRLRVVDYADAGASPLVGRRRSASYLAPLAVAG